MQAECAEWDQGKKERDGVILLVAASPAPAQMAPGLAYHMAHANTPTRQVTTTPVCGLSGCAGMHVQPESHGDCCTAEYGKPYYTH